MTSPDQKTAVLKMTPAAEASTLDPTTIEKPAGSLDRPAGTGGSVGSPIEALERDEILRTRAFSLIVMLIAVVGVFATLIVPGGHPTGKLVMYAGCGVTFVSMLFLLYQTYDPIRFRRPSTILVWFVPAVAVNAPVLYFGVFSPAPMLVVLGLYFIGLGRAGAMAFAAFAICSVMLAVMGTFVVVTGIDVGIMRPQMTSTQQVMILVLEVFLMVITMMIARMSRRAALVAVSELEHATRLAAHRQALLIEAREELERALHPRRGRFSAQAIGSYQLGEVLGRGAMGEVYAAVDTRSGGEVAIKLLSQTSLGNADYVLRFLRELRTAAKVESPHVVRVIEVGEKPVPFLVMERLEGRTLSEILRERRTLEPAEVVELVEQVGIGIAAAAEAGIVHRDLKPQNVFRHHDLWKVLDFGVARAIDHGETLTAGQVVGTPSYMSPEQACGEHVDHRTDLYALAAIAYRALTGHQPFQSADLAEILYRVVHTRPIRPTLLAPDLHPDIDLVLAIGMARDPGERFANATELAAALRDASAGSLAAATRARGNALVHAAGWSTTLKQRHSSRASTSGR